MQLLDGCDHYGGIDMKYKEFGVEYKDAGNGSIEGYASTWIRKPDSYGDVVKQGAFSGTLRDRWNGGKGIPLLWAHQMDNLKSFIGTAEAEEDEKGLHFLAQFDGTEEAQRVRALYKDGRLRKFSFAFDVIDEGPVELDGDVEANELRELDLFEISCVCVPANDDAGVVAVKAGRRNSGKDEGTIRDAISALEAGIASLRSLLDAEDPEDGEDEAKANTAVEEPEQSNPAKDRLLEYIKSLQTED